MSEALTEAGSRVQTIARLHEKLYASENLTEIDFGDYLRSLIDELRGVYGRSEIVFTVITDDMILDVNRATSLGLIANELIVNCLKHAFPAHRSGNVIISLQYIRESGSEHRLARLSVEDNGVGLPSDLKLESLPSMGIELVRLLSQQLEAQCEFKTVTGVHCSITFPVSLV